MEIKAIKPQYHPDLPCLFIFEWFGALMAP